MENPRPYVPIVCAMHDVLESLATLRRECEIVYRDGDADACVRDVIVDVYTRDGAEYIRLRNGSIIRLDDLVTVDGASVTPAC